EHLTLSYSGEESLFIRLSQSKVRQATDIKQGYLTMNFISGKHSTEITFPITGNLEVDLAYAHTALKRCREECLTLPEDPYVVFPEAGASSEEDHYGRIPPVEQLTEALLTPAKSVDLAGLFTSGILMRAYMNSKGQSHWFSTENFYIDYSLYTPSQKAIKATYAGTEWVDAAYSMNLGQAIEQLKSLEATPKKLSPGKYRVYFAPAAVAEFLRVFTWRGISGGALMQGNSPLKKLSEGKASLSPLFTLEENFNQGLVPRFNEFGEISPLHVSLIKEGKLMSTLINQRTAQEYNLQSNAANAHETLRSPRVHPGRLKEEKILSELGTGLYISNLHYLNWSDLQHGRITGMTRYGCFWVENGQIVSPIQDMRFDETLYHFWGNGLEALGEKTQLIPAVFSYGERSLGGISVPGMLVNDFSFTL
ncbi:MAG TPA: metallopeptidase TldD-related protein, partial [Alphaproteobacteria bacterium]|nr:metallopeptidase TldD-related protein [Alphaproteobacteria bacterium]